jgi:hypothetical protein
MPDERTWTHIGGDMEASYDGKQYVDIRLRGRDGEQPKPICFMSKGTLENALTLFNPLPIKEP